MSAAAHDRGWLLGDGLFETVHVIDGAAPLLAAHLARLRRSAAALGIACSGDLADDIRDGLSAAWERAARPARAALRIRLASVGPPGLARPDGGAARLSCEVRPLEPRLFGVPAEPVRAVTVTAHRIDPRAATAGHKTLSWLGFVLARREAVSRGADVGIVTTVAGDIGEADFANVFAVGPDGVVTPPLGSGVLPGITRERALRALAAAGRPAREAPLRPADLEAADEAFLTSSLSGVTPVSSLDATSYAAPGPVSVWLAGCLESDRGPREDAGNRH